MKVTVNGQVLFVGWHYDDKKNPFETQCFVKNNDNEVLYSVSIKKYKYDPQLGGQHVTNEDGRKLKVTEANDTLRRFSLDKLLNTYYSLPSLKQERKAFWDAYNGRTPKATVVCP